MSALRKAIEVSRRREDTAPERLVDVGYQWICDGEVVLQVGGRWDTEESRWTGESSEFVEVQLHAGQLEAARDFCEWLGRHLQYRAHLLDGRSANEARRLAFGDIEPTYLWHFYGGRRAGKTYLALAALVAYAVAVPGAVVLALSPKLEYNAELELALDDLVPARWRKRTGGRVRMATGSSIWFYTGGISKNVKLGSVDIALLNEAQGCNEHAYIDMRGNLSTRGGPLIAAYNPPRTLKGQWLKDVWQACRDGEDRNAREYFFDPRENPHSDDHALQAIGYDERLYRIEVLGDMSTPPTPVVFPLFMARRARRLVVPPEWEDVTEYYARRRCGVRARWIGGLDFDKGAGCSHARLRIYEGERGEHNVLIFAGHREVDFAETHLVSRLQESLGVIPRDDVVWVADASGDWQSTTERGRDKMTSWSLLKRAGWTKLVPPDPHTKRNPQPSIRRYDLTRDLIRDGRLHVMGDCEEVLDCLVNLPTAKDSRQRDRHADRVHLVDAITYAIFRVLVEGQLDIVRNPAAKRRPSGPGPTSSTVGFRR